MSDHLEISNQRGEPLERENAQLRNNVTSVNEQLAWLSGIADGEGCFYLTATHNKTGSPVVKYAFSVGNTNLPLILEVKRIVESLVMHEIRYSNIKGRGNRKRSYLFQVTSLNDLEIVCESMLPFLIAKKAQAELMLDFIWLGSPKGNQWSGVDSEVFEKRLEYVSRMKHLNRYRIGELENQAELRSKQETERLAPTMDEETVRSEGKLSEVPEMSTRLVTQVARFLSNRM